MKVYFTYYTDYYWLKEKGDVMTKYEYITLREMPEWMLPAAE